MKGSFLLHVTVFSVAACQATLVNLFNNNSLKMYFSLASEAHTSPKLHNGSVCWILDNTALNWNLNVSCISAFVFSCPLLFIHCMCSHKNVLYLLSAILSFNIFTADQKFTGLSLCLMSGNFSNKIKII